MAIKISKLISNRVKHLRMFDLAWEPGVHSMDLKLSQSKKLRFNPLNLLRFLLSSKKARSKILVLLRILMFLHSKKESQPLSKTVQKWKKKSILGILSLINRSTLSVLTIRFNQSTLKDLSIIQWSVNVSSNQIYWKPPQTPATKCKVDLTS